MKEGDVENLSWICMDFVVYKPLSILWLRVAGATGIYERRGILGASSVPDFLPIDYVKVHEMPI